MCESSLRACGLSHALTNAYIKCLMPVIGASGCSDNITISLWTLSRYHDPQKVHDSSPSLLPLLFLCFFL